jgi:hypothetical protein
MKNIFLSLMAAISLGLSTLASAVLPVAATTAFTEIQTDGLALIDLAWPLVIAFTTGMIILALFKRIARKAAS